MSQRLYTREDDTFIRENLSSMTHAELGTALNRPRGSISKRVAHLGLSRKTARGRPYTPFEDKVLRTQAGKLSHQQLATQLGRTVFSIRGRMRTLRIDAVHRGEHHWAAKYDDMQALMIGCLADCGFTVTEVYRLLSCTREISIHTVSDIVACRTRCPRIGA